MYAGAHVLGCDIVPSSGTLRRLVRQTGRVVWKRERTGSRFSSPSVAD